MTTNDIIHFPKEEYVSIYNFLSNYVASTGTETVFKEVISRRQGKYTQRCLLNKYKDSVVLRAIDERLATRYARGVRYRSLHKLRDMLIGRTNDRN